jgi:hypothetical protein
MQRKIDPSLLWLVAIKDKEMANEPHIAFAVIEALTSDAAIKAMDPAIEELRKANRCRCVPVLIGTEHAPFQINRVYSWHWIDKSGPFVFDTKTDLKACQHLSVHQGKNAPRRYGSYRTEVCNDCGMFRLTGHNPRKPMSGWKPASEYAAAISEDDD